MKVLKAKKRHLAYPWLLMILIGTWVFFLIQLLLLAQATVPTVNG